MKYELKFQLPLTLDEQTELIGLCLSLNVKVAKQELLIEELNKQLQAVILELEVEKEVNKK